jgi:hypothetical protein
MEENDALWFRSLLTKQSRVTRPHEAPDCLPCFGCGSAINLTFPPASVTPPALEAFKSL